MAGISACHEINKQDELPVPSSGERPPDVRFWHKAETNAKPETKSAIGFQRGHGSIPRLRGRELQMNRVRYRWLHVPATNPIAQPIVLSTVTRGRGRELVEDAVGGQRQIGKRTPVALATALAIAGATGIDRAFALRLGAQRPDLVIGVGEIDLAARNVGEGRECDSRAAPGSPSRRCRRTPSSRRAPSRSPWRWRRRSGRGTASD